MKQLLFVISLLLLAVPISAAELELSWEASVSPDVEGYAVFSKDYQGPYNYDDPVWQGAGLSCTVIVPDDRQTAFVIRSFAYGPYDLSGDRETVWSGDSSEAVHVPDKPIPEPPGNIFITILVAVKDFFSGLLG